MSKNEIIGFEGPRPEVNRKEHPERTYRIRGKRTRGASQHQFLDYLRTGWGRTNREVHSDGFLALNHEAKECRCGGCCLWSDNYVCPRCGKNNG